MNIEQFRKSPAGRLIKVGQGGTAYYAFLPHPLPPRLEYSSLLVTALSAADRALGELAGLCRNLANLRLFISPFIRREAVLSSRIEGTEADIAQLYAYEAGQMQLWGRDASSPEAEIREVLNYVKALEYGLERLESLPVSLRLIRELHQRLVQGVRGQYATPGDFRRSQNWIGKPGCLLNEAEFVPPPEKEMLEALNAFEKYLHSEDSHPPLIRLAMIHYQFEAIHPFLDGNGRIGRLLISLLLVSWNLLPSPLLYLSAYFERHRQDYYELLLGVSSLGAWEEWIRFFLLGVAEQAADAVRRAQRLQDLKEDWRHRLTRAQASTLLLALADALFEYPVVTIPQAQRILGVTYRTAQLNVAKLVDAGILAQIGNVSYGKVFFAKDIIEIIND